MGAPLLITKWLIGLSILYTIIMGLIAMKTVPTKRPDLEEKKNKGKGR